VWDVIVKGGGLRNLARLTGLFYFIAAVEGFSTIVCRLPLSSGLPFPAATAVALDAGTTQRFDYDPVVATEA
jgi:hypothetical protein